MQFVNLTPFDALCFNSIDPQDRDCSTVVIKVGYDIRIDSLSGAASLVLKEERPSALLMQDSYWSDASSSSLRQESDVVPFKPLCDLIVLGSAYAPEGKSVDAWPVQIEVLSPLADKPDELQTVLKKKLIIYPPGIFQRGLFGWKLQRDKVTTQVPLRWENSFGGSSQILNPRFGETPEQPEFLLNEVCFTNPLGCGWQHQGFKAAVQKSGLKSVEQIPAPCIFYPNEYLKKPVTVKHRSDITSAAHICAAATTYRHRSAGFGATPRHCAPRIALGGTYDDNWLNTRWPLLPHDFDEQFWNCAPPDQQLPWPSAASQINTWFLFNPELAPKGYVELRLPGHRAFVMARLKNKSPLPLPAQIDTLILDTDKRELQVVWRCRLIQSPVFAQLEARFEIDPHAPLLKWQTLTTHASTSPGELAHVE